MSTIKAIGLISGTSMDGVDAALLTIGVPGTPMTLEGAFTLPYPLELKARLMRACHPSTGRVDEICELNFLVGEYFATAALKVARLCSLPIDDVDLIGSHGQTIYHSPVSPTAVGSNEGRVNSTLQIGEPAVIAARTGVTTIADFRTADMAAGGTGAPLVPYAHYLLFKHLALPLAVHNIGGISNLTIIPGGGDISSILAFDTGPGNMVADALVAEFTGGEKSCDEGGSFSSGGRVNDGLLDNLLEHPFFELPPPKATGREVFGADYARAMMVLGAEMGAGESDLVATALALTAETIARSYRDYVLPGHPVKEVLFCGGGVKNPTLTAMLRERLSPIHIGTTDDFGVPSDYLEAMAFALLARETVSGRASNLPSVTGAAKRVILGKISPGDNYRRLMRAEHLSPEG